MHFGQKRDFPPQPTRIADMFKNSQKDPIKTIDRRVAALRFSNSNLVAVVLTALCALAWLVPAVLTALIHPVYANSCKGCDLFLEVTLVVVLPFVLSVPLEIVLTNSLTPFALKDVDNMGRDMIRGNVAQTIFYLMCWALKAADPGLLDYKNVVSYEWLIVAAVGLIWMFEVVVPMLEVIRNTKHTSLE
jgi:hypothetical protein